MEDYFPDFKWYESWRMGFSKIIITIFYFIIPILVVIFLALITNVFGNLLDIAMAIISHAPSIIMGEATVADALYQSSFPLFVSVAITFSLGMMVYLIFSFFQAMSEARLAHTGSLKHALNLYGAARDITRIGIGKLLLLSLIIFVIVAS